LAISLPRLLSLFKKKSEVERRYYEVTPRQRWTMGLLYFALIVLLVFGMKVTHREPMHRTLNHQMIMS
jgi:hypothetical protein